MLIIPAIDLRGGKVVRLRQGKRNEETIYSRDPVDVAQGWKERGAGWLHVVDLDGAFQGSPRNLEILERMVEAVEIAVEFGGGMRAWSDIEQAINIGVERVILGSAAPTNQELVQQAVQVYGERIVVAIDARGGKVCTYGWERDSDSSPLRLAKEMKSCGVARIIYTDISRDGTMRGPNIEMTKKIASETGLKIIASGGISTLQEIKELKRLEEHGVEGVIIGKALYEGRIELKEAIEVAEGGGNRDVG